MSSKRPHIDPAVIAVVKAWAAADDLDEAAAALANGRRSLDPPLQAQLRSEIAEISAHTLLEVMTMERGVDGGEAVDVGGVALLPKQVERVSAWRHDQEPTADALGVEVERWHQMVVEGMEAVVAELADAPPTQGSPAAPAGSAAERADKARALLGNMPSTFEDRPTPGSEQAGLSGILAAKAFAKGKKKR